MKKVLLGLLIISMVGVGLLTYVGMMPVLSPLLVKAKDLGVEADPALVQAFDAEHEMKNELPDGKVPEDREPSYAGSKALDVNLSSKEVTSILDYWQNQYSKTPIREVQVRFNPDGSGEASGILEVGTAILMAKQLGFSDADIEKGKSYVKYVAGDIPFYVAGEASVQNNQVSFNASKIEVGRLQVPGNLAGPVSRIVETAVERRIGQVPGAVVEEFNHQNGEAHLVATVPDTIK